MDTAIKVHHIALRVADPHASAVFYSGLLGLPEVRRIGDQDGLRAVWLRAQGTLLMLERALRGSGAAEGSGHLLAFGVDDLDGWERRLTTAGVTIADRTAHTLYFADPDNHRVAVSVYRAED